MKLATALFTLFSLVLLPGLASACPQAVVTAPAVVQQSVVCPQVVTQAVCATQFVRVRPAVVVQQVPMVCVQPQVIVAQPAAIQYEYVQPAIVQQQVIEQRAVVCPQLAVRAVSLASVQTCGLFSRTPLRDALDESKQRRAERVDHRAVKSTAARIARDGTISPHAHVVTMAPATVQAQAVPQEQSQSRVPAAPAPDNGGLSK